MISINMKIITTNVRIRENDLLQIRAIAAEAGMSFNEYVNKVLQQTAVIRELGITNKTASSPIWSLAKLAGKSKKSGLSKEDKIIYE